MIGIVICAHGSLGTGMRRAAEMIIGEQPQLAVVEVNPGDSGGALVQRLEGAIAQVDGGDGVLLVTDMFGGTPTNICCTLLGRGDVEVVTGVNLPLMVKALTGRSETVSLAQLAAMATTYGQRYIAVAGELLRGEGMPRD